MRGWVHGSITKLAGWHACRSAGLQVSSTESVAAAATLTRSAVRTRLVDFQNIAGFWLGKECVPYPSTFKLSNPYATNALTSPGIHSSAEQWSPKEAQYDKQSFKYHPAFNPLA